MGQLTSVCDKKNGHNGVEYNCRAFFCKHEIFNMTTLDQYYKALSLQLPLMYMNPWSMLVRFHSEICEGNMVWP